MDKWPHLVKIDRNFFSTNYDNLCTIRKPESSRLRINRRREHLRWYFQFCLTVGAAETEIGHQELRWNLKYRSRTLLIFGVHQELRRIKHPFVYIILRKVLKKRKEKSIVRSHPKSSIWTETSLQHLQMKNKKISISFINFLLV